MRRLGVSSRDRARRRGGQDQRPRRGGGGAGAHRRARQGPQCVHRRHARACARQGPRHRRGSRRGQAAWARSPACRSRSRTCSTWPACRRWPAPRSTATAPPASADATLIARLEAAGAVLVGALNMGEYAYDFTGENVHDGPSRNPHDTSRMTGGSSGGSGGAVAGGLVPFALGSDTNGSIRVPSSFCGLFGLKPTYGRLSRARTFPFVASLDHLGPLARTTRDLALAYDAMQGHDPERSRVRRRGRSSRCCRSRARHERPAHRGRRRLFQARRLARGAGRRRRASPRRSTPRARSRFPKPARARAAAFVITTTEGAALHLDRLRTRARDFDPAVRDRLIAGAMVPASLVVKAQKFRRWYRERGAEAVRGRRCHPGAGHARCPRRASASRP